MLLFYLLLAAAEHAFKGSLQRVKCVNIRKSLLDKKQAKEIKGNEYF